MLTLAMLPVSPERPYARSKRRRTAADDDIAYTSTMDTATAGSTRLRATKAGQRPSR